MNQRKKVTPQVLYNHKKNVTPQVSYHGEIKKALLQSEVMA